MKRYLGSCFARQTLFIVFGFVAVMLVAIQSPVHAASPSIELKKMMSKMDRQLCRSLSLAACKRQTVQKKAKQKSGKPAVVAKSKPRKTKTVKLKPAVEVVPPAEKSTDRKPTPVLKQVNPQDVAAKQTFEKDMVPTPVLKPAVLTKETIVPAAPSAVETKTLPEKLPEPKVVILPAPKLPTPLSTEPQIHAMPDGTPTGEACFDSLGTFGVKFTRLTTQVGTGACSVADAVEVQSISIGQDVLKLSDQPTFNCGFALKFASWVRDEAVPSVKTATDKKIVSIGTGPGYQCRGRNGDSSAKLSEHAFGNAVDIERIKLSDGETIEVKDALSIGAKFQPVLAVLRATSCQYFTTVLGPGANEAHATHFHFDLARRGKKGNHAMCQ